MNPKILDLAEQSMKFAYIKCQELNHPVKHLDSIWISCAMGAFSELLTEEIAQSIELNNPLLAQNIRQTWQRPPQISF
jgi:hypothetical protein